MQEDNEFRVVIKSTKQGEEAVPAVIFADYIRAIQNIAYVAGDYFWKNPHRKSGDFPKKVKDNCTLVFRDLKIGSIDATMSVQPRNHTLFKMDSIGMQAFDLIRETILVVNSENNINDKLFETIPDEFRNSRILKEMDKIWPDESSGYTIEMKYKNSEPISFSPKRKSMIQQANKKKPMKYSAEIYGRVVDVRVDNKQKFELNTTIGVVEGQYDIQQADLFKSLLGSFVKISGVVVEKGNKKTITLNSADKESIVRAESIPLNKLTTGPGDPIDLTETLMIDVEWDTEEKEFILTNEQYNLLAVADSLKKGMKEIENGMLFLRDEYLREDDANLTKGARVLKSRLDALFCNGE